MKVMLRRHFGAAVLTLFSMTSLADVVIKDRGVSMSREELEHIVSQWTPQMKSDAANDIGDRMELLNRALASKKVAMESEQLTAEKDGDAYWQKELMVRQLLQSFMVRRFLASIEMPDMTDLAKERYATEKDKYAAVPPRRLTSHILILCPIGSESCNREEARAKADQVLAELKAGADFEELVQKYSQDPASKNRNGRFDKWLEPEMSRSEVDREYLKAALALEEEGDYSDVVIGAFGFHIIRLDKSEDLYYKPFEQVEEQIVADLKQEYGQMRVREYEASYRFSDDLYIDGEAMEEILAPYKTTE